jgi:hypothetical protein
MEKASVFSRMVIDMKETGKMICLMVKESTTILRGICIKASLLTGKRLIQMLYFSLLMVQSMLEDSKRM